MKTHTTKILTICILGLIPVLLVIYAALGLFYRDRFEAGTWINGIYCTGRNVTEVNELLIAQTSYEGLEVTDEDGENMYISPEDCGICYDYTDALKNCLQEQNEWTWPVNIISPKNITVQPNTCIDEAKLDTYLDTQPMTGGQPEGDVSLHLTASGYEISDTMLHRRDTDKIREAVKEAILESETELLIDDTYYTDLAYTDEQRDTMDRYDELKDMLTARITYRMGEDEEVIDEKTLSTFLKKDDNGDSVRPLEWDDAAIEEWVDELADNYDSVGKTRYFHATCGKTVTVKGGIYGNRIDRSAEKEYLKDAVYNGVCETHEPEYTQKAMYQGLDDLGDTYIEVNMTDQMLYYYREGKCIIETPVVTGNMFLNHGTPVGTNYVYYKQKNRTLHGADYVSFVKYWIAVRGAIGIHDASWRDEYGGDIYKTSGSHGCINTPEEKVSELYDLVELGTPAVMFYTD